MRIRSLIVVALLNACSSPRGGGEPAEVPVEAAPPPPGEEVSVTPPPSASAVPEPTVAPPPAPPVVEKYALVVSFFSPGNGTDREAYDRLLALVKKQPKHLAAITGRWGKEGEHDECFQLTELSDAEKKAFIAAVKKEMSSSKRVNVGEDAECKAR